jgi:ribonuclease P protein component
VWGFLNNQQLISKNATIFLIMIAQKFRFHGHASLKYVFARGQKIHSHAFVLKYLENPRRRRARLSVVVSKKVFKSAVKRNHIRRRVYEIARPFVSNSDRAIDAVISVNSPEILTASHEALTLQLLPLLHQAGFRATK